MKHGSMITGDWISRLAKADKKYGMRIMEGAVQTLQQKLGEDYEHVPGITPFELGEYLIIREDVMAELRISEREMKKFDLRVEEIVLG